MQDYQNVIEEIYLMVEAGDNPGEIASYIPELRNVDPHMFGVCLTTLAGEQFGAGDYQERFSIQSIAKVLSLSLAFSLIDEKVWDRVGVEPSGTAFNSLVQLESEEGIPRNPLINAGAMVIADILCTELENPKKEFLEFVRSAANNQEINYSPEIAASEKSVGYRNLALINFLKSFRNIQNNTDEVIDFYFHLCSIQMTCAELSNTFLFFANDGIQPQTGRRILKESKSKRLSAIMQTCGFYDETGEFAFRVGLPGKSGVGGGVVAFLPDRYAISVWSPRLNLKGNSSRGMNFLELFTSRTETSIF